MRAGDMTRPITAGLIAALALCACTTTAGGPDPAGSGAPRAASSQPQFFVQWKDDLPGLTRRPAVSQDSVLPDYPAAAIRGDVSGTTTLETCVTADGRLADPRIVESSGSAVLDDATLAWARVATFLPAVINDQPFAVCGYRFDQEWRVSN